MPFVVHARRRLGSSHPLRIISRTETEQFFSGRGAGGARTSWRGETLPTADQPRRHGARPARTPPSATPRRHGPRAALPAAPSPRRGRPRNAEPAPANDRGRRFDAPGRDTGRGAVGLLRSSAVQTPGPRGRSVLEKPGPRRAQPARADWLAVSR
ncbi:hypothetical protein E0504_21705 [Parafrankia sp. BMG5.11]|nr:hypothetical protein E0504_21705 [Parafrankia sp. BMG5.11]